MRRKAGVLFLAGSALAFGVWLVLACFRLFGHGQEIERRFADNLSLPLSPAEAEAAKLADALAQPAPASPGATQEIERRLDAALTRFLALIDPGTRARLRAMGGEAAALP